MRSSLRLKLASSGISPAILTTAWPCLNLHVTIISMPSACSAPKFLRNARLLYFRIDVETAIQRVRQRYCQTGCQLVSEQILRNYYHDDGFVEQLPLMKKDFPLHQTIEICDNNETLQLFLQRLDRFFELLLKQEARAKLTC